MTTYQKFLGHVTILMYIIVGIMFTINQASMAIGLLILSVLLTFKVVLNITDTHDGDTQKTRKREYSKD